MKGTQWEALNVRSSASRNFSVYKGAGLVFVLRPTRVTVKDAPLVPGWWILMIHRYRARGNPVN